MLNIDFFSPPLETLVEHVLIIIKWGFLLCYLIPNWKPEFFPLKHGKKCIPTNLCARSCVGTAWQVILRDSTSFHLVLLYSLFVLCVCVCFFFLYTEMAKEVLHPLWARLTSLCPGWNGEWKLCCLICCIINPMSVIVFLSTFDS